MAESKLYRENEKPEETGAAPKNSETIPSPDTAFDDVWSETLAAADAFAAGADAQDDGAAEKQVSSETGGRLSRHGRGRKGLAAWIAAAAVVVILLSVAVWGMFVYDDIYPGVRMLGVDGGGLTAAQMAEKIAAAEEELYANGQLPVLIDGKEYQIDAGEAGVEIDERAAAEAAAAYGREGSLLTRAGQILGALFGGCDLPAPEITFDEAALSAQIEEITVKASAGYADPSYYFEEGILYIDTGSAGLHLDADELYSVVAERLASGDFSALSYETAPDEPAPVDLPAILREMTSEKQNARLDLEADPKGTVILPHSDGVVFDEAAALALFEAREGRYVEIPAEYDPAEVTAEMLTEGLFRDILADVTTKLNKNLVGRTTNVRLAANFVNGTILNPGDEFSYNTVVGPRTEERGFKDAKIFERGEIVDGLGGGICQVSTTLYMAALRSDLQITERRNHQFVVSYAPIGEDATVVYGNTDFRFINNTSYPIKIEAVQSGSTMKAVFYGTKVNENTVKLVTTVLKKTPYEKIEQEDDTLDYGKQVVETEGHTGYKTVTYRVIYDKDGKEISRVKENESTYIKLDEVIRIGVKGKPVSTDPETPDTPVVGPGEGGETPVTPVVPPAEQLPPPTY